FLISLTKYVVEKKLYESNIKYVLWSEVYTLLEETGREDSSLRFVHEQFMDFLKDKDMQPIKLPKTSKAALAGQIQGIRFREGLEAILRRIQQHPRLRDLFRRSKIKFERYEKPDEN